MKNRRYNTEKFWDRAAPDYDNAEASDSHKHELVFDTLKKYMLPADKVLDLGCGTGLMASRIAGHVQQVTGIDISSQMIRKAQERALQNSLTNTHFLKADVFDEKLSHHSFECITANYLLHLLPDLQAVLQRADHLLKPGGYFMATTPCMKEKPLLLLALKGLSKIKLAPDITGFSLPGLKRTLTRANWQMVECLKLSESDPEYLTIMKKIGT